MDKKRILVAHNVSPARTGGMSRVMGFIHDELAASEGWEIDYFCADRMPPGSGGLSARWRFPQAVMRHAREAARLGRPYNLINIHEPLSALIVAMRRLLGGVRVVVTSYGLEQRAWELDHVEHRLGRKWLGWRSRLARPLTILWPSRWALKHADHILCANGEDRAYLQTRFSVPVSQITHFCPGANPIFAQAADGRSYAKVEQLLFAGTWRHNKGTFDMAPMFEKLSARYPNLALCIIGAGLPADEVLRDFSDAVRPKVRVIPFVTEEEAAAAFAAADLFVLPSLFEGTPLTLMEAMASGLPIVTTDVCGMRDVIQHGQNGLLAPVRSPDAIASALTNFLENEELRKKLGQKASEESRAHYSWAQAAIPVRDAYQTLLASL